MIKIYYIIKVNKSFITINIITYLSAIKITNIIHLNQFCPYNYIEIFQEQKIEITNFKCNLIPYTNELFDNKIYSSHYYNL